MLIKGLQKLTLLDFPEKVACTVFTGGCNFRCPFCHNAALALGERVAGSETMSEEYFFDFLGKRRGILQGVCVSGGEPTLQPDLLAFLGKIKDMGFLVKLDTNGYKPDVLSEAISAGVVDYVAMDIKNSKEKYGITVGVENFDVRPIERSAEVLLRSNIPFEFRTTLVRELHTEEDMLAIGEWLRGDEKYFLQTFKDSEDLICSGFSGYDEKETAHLLNLLKRTIPFAQIRG